MKVSFTTRFRRLRAGLRRARAAALLVSHRPNIFYLTGFSGDNGMLVVSPSKSILLTDPRFESQAPVECRDSPIRVAVTRRPLAEAAGELLASIHGRGTVAFEEDRLTVGQLRQAREAAGSRWGWTPAPGMVEALREVKDEDEIVRMRAAARTVSRVVQYAVQVARAGVRELDVAAEIEYRMKKLGAEGPSFETIVASGARSALPHGRASSKRLKEKDLVVLDLGVILHGYCSDLTRTIHVGRASSEVRGWYKAVLEAQTAARAAVSAGVEAAAVDEAARSVLRVRALDGYFIHSTGHGLGLEVHERPSLRKGEKSALKAGSVVTIEPGIYLPGRGGIRIEDDLLVLERGSETLTSASRELIEV